MLTKSVDEVDEICQFGSASDGTDVGSRPTQGDWNAANDPYARMSMVIDIPGANLGAVRAGC